MDSNKDTKLKSFTNWRQHIITGCKAIVLAFYVYVHIEFIQLYYIYLTDPVLWNTILENAKQHRIENLIADIAKEIEKNTERDRTEWSIGYAIGFILSIVLSWWFR